MRRARSSSAAGLVSVLVPVYNGVGYLEDALDSLERQTYRPIEVVVYDDASTDGSWELIVAAAQTSSLRFVTLRGVHNYGATVAVEKCVEASSSDSRYVLHFAQDDVLPRNFVQRMVRRQVKTGAVVVQAPAVPIDERGRQLAGRIAPVLLPRSLTIRMAFLLSRNPVVAIGALALKSKVTREALVAENALCQDWEQFIHYGLRGPIVIEYGTASYYRIRQDSLSRTASRRSQETQEAAMLMRARRVTEAWLGATQLGVIKWKLVCLVSSKVRAGARAEPRGTDGSDLRRSQADSVVRPVVSDLAVTSGKSVRWIGLSNRIWVARATLALLRDFTRGCVIRSGQDIA